MNKSYLSLLVSGVSFTLLGVNSVAFACDSTKYNAHPNGGGMVNDCATVAPSAYIHNAQIDAGVSVGDKSKIENSRILGKTTIFENCDIDNSTIANSSVQSGASIDNTNMTNSSVQSKAVIDNTTMVDSQIHASSNVDNTTMIDSIIETTLEIDNSNFIDVVVKSPLSAKSYLAVDNSNLIHALVKSGSVVNMVTASGKSKNNKKEI